MAVRADDGTPFTNRSAMKRHNTRLSTNKQAAAKESEDQVVAKHGPAHQVTVTHTANSHTVHSKHDDGYEHHDQHDTAEAANEAGQTLMGAHDTGGSATRDGGLETDHDGSAGIPGLS